MTTKQTILGMTAVFVLCMGYYLYLDLRVWPSHPEWFRTETTPDQTESSPLSSQPSTTSVSASTVPSTQSSIAPATIPAGLQAS